MDSLAAEAGAAEAGAGKIMFKKLILFFPKINLLCYNGYYGKGGLTKKL